MRTGCYICSKKIDKFYLLATPDGKKYKVCSRCMNMARAFNTVSNQEEKDEAVASETTE